MGTNFYWVVPERPTLPTGASPEVPWDDPSIHIGKRSAAGRYCWDCDVTLCIGGREKVHTGSGFRDECPKCGKLATAGGLDKGAAGVELGFAQPNTDRPTGVTSASSFTWAQDPMAVLKVLQERSDEELVVDEYDRKYTCKAFAEMLAANCPLRYDDAIGTHFS